jgi:tetratricopeptide (TPR) repeat protein
MKRGQYTAALAACDRAKALGRDTPEIDARRASILQALDRLPEAATAARLALARQPDLVQMHALLGDLALAGGELSEARAQLAQAQRLHPRHPSTLLLDARLATHEGRLAEALILFNEVTRVAPGVARFEWFAAQAARAAKDDPGLQAHCLACLKVAPDFGPCREVCSARLSAP